VGPLDVLQEIVGLHPEIACLSTRQVQPGGLFQARASSELAEPLIERALEIRNVTGLPFMDAINMSIAQDQRADADIVRQIAFHNFVDRPFWHSVDSDLARSISEQMSGPAMCVISSVLRLRDGSIRHLSMIDFHIVHSSAVLAIVELICRELGGSGWILDSGRSYHYYGTRILTSDELSRFLGKALLFAPLTDRAWIAHQLIDGACSLRLAEHASKIGRPVVVADFSGR